MVVGEKEMKTAKDILYCVFTIVLVFSMSIGIWKFVRYANYTFSYEDMVREQIESMVKPEALK